MDTTIRRNVYSKTVRLKKLESADVEVLSNTEFGSINLSELSED